VKVTTLRRIHCQYTREVCSQPVTHVVSINSNGRQPIRLLCRKHGMEVANQNDIDIDGGQ
jgi:hypothetical protein